MALDVHVVTHTHWDREWYLPFERFRQRLVALVDELIDDPPSAGESFLLDGQAIILDDYAAVRPERIEQLRAFVREGRLEAGPWYVLADELIPSGEALVRNLLAGQRALRRFGGQPPPVLYCPDSFGHPAALPAVAAGFGLPLIILWRGYGGPGWPDGDTVRWSAPNGDEVLLFHLPRDGYEFGSHLPTTSVAARERWSRMRAELVPRSSIGVMLVLNGADHHARQLGWRDALAALETAGESDGVRRSSLRGFAQQLVERSSGQRLPVIRGELRDSYGYTWALQGTLATRAHEKRLNARAERVLLRDTEPWSALASRRGPTKRAFVEEAWRTLLTAQPHDTLCGCSIDDVADAMELRLRSSTLQADGIRDDAILDLIGHDPVAARDARDRWRSVVLVRNAAPRPRSGVAIIEIEEFVADVPVGPGSAAPPVVPPTLRKRRPNVAGLSSMQVLSRGTRYSRTESPRHYPDNDLVSVTRVAAWIHEAPPYGIVSYPVGGNEVAARTGAPRVTTSATTLENALLAIGVSADGTVSLEHKESGRRIESLLELTDEADVGDLYTPAPRLRDVKTEFRGVRRMRGGPLRGELALRYRVIDASAARRRTDVHVNLRLILDAGAPFLRIAVAGTNHRKWHRTRLAVRSDVSSPSVWADAAFGAVNRERALISDAEALVEHAPPTAPLHRYVSLFSVSGGCTVFSDGLGEYEATYDGSVAITLVRAVGELSRNDLPERPGHAGWPTPTPKAQCIGPFEANFGVMLHGPRLPATIDAIERAADDLLCPLTGATLRSALELPSRVLGVELTGTGLAFSALKESESGEWLVLRCVNLRDDEVDGSWMLPFDIQEARLARLDETIIGDIVTSNRTLTFRAAPRAIVTILVR
jgi:mannosylglycerate hydrolase